MGFNPQECLKRNVVFTFKANENCFVTKEDVLQKMGTYRSVARKVLVQFPGVIVYDPLRYLCDEKFCYGKSNDELLYMDTHHLNSIGSRHLAETFKF
jgi:hypothetical protein